MVVSNNRLITLLNCVTLNIVLSIVYSIFKARKNDMARWGYDFDAAEPVYHRLAATIGLYMSIHSRRHHLKTNTIL